MGMAGGREGGPLALLPADLQTSRNWKSEDFENGGPKTWIFIIIKKYILPVPITGKNVK